MKNNILTLLLFLLIIPVHAQDAAFEYAGRSNPSVKKEKLKQVQSIGDISPELWKKIGLPFKEYEELERRRKITYSFGSYVDPSGGYNTAIDYVSVEISTISKGKALKAKSAGEELSTEQKNILNNADPDSDIRITIKFRYKTLGVNDPGDDKIIEGGLKVTIVPETEAEYPGGFKQLTAYLTQNVMNKIAGTNAFYNIARASVKFTVNEEGEVVNANMKSSCDVKTDKLVLDAISKMPKWKPAKNSKGIHVKQEFTIPFGIEGC